MRGDIDPDRDPSSEYLDDHPGKNPFKHYPGERPGGVHIGLTDDARANLAAAIAATPDNHPDKAKLSPSS